MNNVKWYIIAGAVLGVLGATLVHFGNPGNMGVCVACFLRDTTGALGFHRAAAVQYIRPEIIGLVFGGFLASVLWTREFAPVTGSSPFAKFFLGIFAMIGCLVFLGCPWRAFLRLGGGDLSALAGIAGLICGVAIGFLLKKRGYEASKEARLSGAIGILPVLLGAALLAALVFELKTGEGGALFISAKGPGAQHAAVGISLAAGIIVGAVMHKSKFCSVGAFGRIFRGDFSMFWGVLSVIVFASIANIAFGQYKLGFEGQPIAHNDFV